MRIRGLTPYKDDQVKEKRAPVRRKHKAPFFLRQKVSLHLCYEFTPLTPVKRATGPLRRPRGHRLRAGGLVDLLQRRGAVFRREKAHPPLA